MKTILYVHHCSSIGGGSYCMLNILKSLDRDLYNPIVLLSSQGPLVEEIKKLDIKVHFLANLDSVPYNRSLFNRGTLSKYWKVNNSIKGYIAKLNEIKPDLVYLNSMMLYPYLKSTHELGIKTIIHIREHWPLNEHIYQLHRAQKYIREYSSYVLAINDFSSRQVPGIKNKVSIVYDWIDLKSRYKELPFASFFNEDVTDKRIILFTGGSAQNKGAKEVAQIFSEELTDSNLRLLMLGNSIRDFVPSWKNRIKIALSKLHILEFYTYELNEIVKRDSRIVCAPNIYEIKHLLDQCYCQVSFFTIPHANLAMAECIVNNTVCLGARTEESEEYSMNGRLAFLYEMNNKKSFVDTFHQLENEYSNMKQNLIKDSHIICKKFRHADNMKVINEIYMKLLS